MSFCNCLPPTPTYCAYWHIYYDENMHFTGLVLDSKKSKIQGDKVGDAKQIEMEMGDPRHK